MREPSEYLSARELFILENHPGMSYAKIGEVLGISGNRVQQIKSQAERRIREEKRRDNARAIAQQEVQLTLTRREVWVIVRGLQELKLKHLATHADQRRRHLENDPDKQLIEPLIKLLREV